MEECVRQARLVVGVEWRIFLTPHGASVLLRSTTWRTLPISGAQGRVSRVSDRVPCASRLIALSPSAGFLRRGCSTTILRNQNYLELVRFKATPIYCWRSSSHARKVALMNGSFVALHGDKACKASLVCACNVSATTAGGKGEL